MCGDRLRATFDQDPEPYARARPRYPAELFDELGELAEIGPGARVAEIGPGTGQATAALAARGASVVAVELGAGLAGVLRRELAGPQLEIVVSAFEDWTLPSEPFDTLAAFTSWHWLDPAVRAAKAAAAVRPGGALVTVTTTHVFGGTEGFFVDVQDCYERWDQATPPGLRAPPADEVPAALDEVDDCELFMPAVRRRFQHDVAYTTSGYLEVIGTYSNHRALTPSRRRGLFSCVGVARMRQVGSLTLAAWGECAPHTPGLRKWGRSRRVGPGVGQPLQRLLDGLASNTAQVAGLELEHARIVAASDSSNGDDEHDPEGATVAFERQQVVALLRQARRTREDLERALVGLEEGRYGACEQCGGAIGVERLEARPSAQTCFTCAS